jgi:hypothetical protein
MDDDFTLVLGIVHLALWLLASIYALGLAALLFYGLYCALAARRLRGVQYKKAKGRPLDSTSLPESLGSS